MDVTPRYYLREDDEMTSTESDSRERLTGKRLSAEYFTDDRYLGFIVQLGATTVEVELESASGSNRPRVTVGSHVTVLSDEYLLLGNVINVRLKESHNGHADGNRLARGVPVATVQLLSTISTVTSEVSRGVVASPRLGDSVYDAHSEVVRLVAETRPSAAARMGEQVTFNFATLPDRERTPLTFTPEMLFGRHCAVIGASGGGKSWSVARLVEEAAQYNSKVVMIDATGEFATLGQGVLHAHIGNHPNPSSYSMEVVLPYHQLTETDLFAVFRPSGQSQAPKLRAAIKTLKLVRIAPAVAVDGIVIKANRAKQHYDAEYARHFAQLERPDAVFDISRLVRQLHNECVNPNRSATEPQYWGEINSVEQAHCVPLINRIQDILNSETLASIFAPGEKPSLIEVIDRFLEHPTAHVLCVSMQYLSFAHHAREIIANTVGRYLLKHAREQRFRKHPLVVTIDEAHQFFDRNTDNREEAYPLDSFGLIAKEGRKYGLTLVIATQRPREIPETILSQFGTMIVHRLINDRDRGVVERAVGELDRSMLDALPGLAPGQAVVLGIDFPVPIQVNVRKPEAEPNSRGPNYQECWSHPEKGAPPKLTN